MLAVGLLAAFHEAAVGDEVLDGREALDVVDLVQKHEAQDLADPRHGAEAGEGVDIVHLGGAGEVQLEVGEEPIIVVEQGHVVSVLLGIEPHPAPPFHPRRGGVFGHHHLTPHGWQGGAWMRIITLHRTGARDARPGP